MVDLTSTGLTLNFRPGFGLAHLRTASKLSGLCREVEVKNEGAKFESIKKWGGALKIRFNSNELAAF